MTRVNLVDVELTGTQFFRHRHIKQNWLNSKVFVQIV